MALGSAAGADLPKAVSSQHKVDPSGLTDRQTDRSPGSWGLGKLSAPSTPSLPVLKVCAPQGKRAAVGEGNSTSYTPGALGNV